MKVRLGKNRILKMCSISLIMLVFVPGSRAITVQAEGIYIQQDTEDERMERETGKEAEELLGLLKSGDTSRTAEQSETAEETGEENITGSALYPKEQFQGMADGTVSLNEILLKSKMNVLRTETTDNTFNIENGDIVLKPGGAYSQTNDTSSFDSSGEVSDETFVINGGLSGGTDKYNITVKQGANPVITLEDLKIDLSSLSDLSPKSPLYIESGAAVTLVLSGGSEDAAVFLQGSPLVSGITLETGATLRIQGEGDIFVYGGGGAYAVGNGNTAGGSFWVGEDAGFQAYSNRADGAINVKVSQTADTRRILQGTLAAALEGAAMIKAENRDDWNEQYIMNLPDQYRSFAVSTTTAGGDYVSYIAADENAGVKDSMLLANSLNKAQHSYNLTGAGNTIASLKELKSQKITYTVILDANGGTFSDRQPKKMYDIGYGTAISLPAAAALIRDNHDFSGWHRTKDSFEAGDEWNSDRKVVRDSTWLYASWIPRNCTVEYRYENETKKKVEGKQFGDTLSDDESKTEENPPTIDKKGYTIVGWLAEDGSRWIFGDEGTKLTKETTILKPYLLADCKVTFNENAGKDSVAKMPSPNPMTVPATTTLSAVTAVPERADYTFIGWYRDAKCTKPWDMNTDKVTAGITLYAGWGANETIVTYHVAEEEGESVDTPSRTVRFGDMIPQPNAAKDDRKTSLPTGYAVEGWYTDEKLTNKWDFSEGLKDSDGKLDLYVKWHQVTCWATFQPNSMDAELHGDPFLSVGYSESLKGVHVDLENKLESMITRTGYEVKNWVTSGGKVWDMSAPLTEDIVLKAQWTPKIYEINFETPQEGAPALAAGESTKEIAYGKTLSKPKYPAVGETWPGHTFRGWYTKEDGEGKQWKFAGEVAADTIEGEMSLYAYWTQDDYTVSFRTYPEDENPPESAVYHYGDQLTEPAGPVRSRYQFLGWYKDENGTELWDFDKDAVIGDMTLYAGWQGEPVDVVLNIEYEPENEDPGKVIQMNVKGVRFGDILTQEMIEDQEKEATQKRPGYTLNGWYTTNAYQDEELWDFAQNRAEPGEGEPLMLYAYWTWDAYSAQFITYEGDSSVPPQTGLRYGNLLTKPLPDPAREHYTFGAWHTVQDPKDDTTAWDFAKSRVTGDMSLYAAWVPDVYTLSFETNGGTALEPVKVTYGTYVSGESLKTAKEGYVLAGWYRDPELTQPFVPASEYVDQTMTIYAKWELKKYTVRYHYRDSADGDEEQVDTYTEAYRVGDYLTKPNKTVPHKTLSPWYQDEAYQDKWVFKRDQVRGDTDLYAYWSDTQYTVHFETCGGTEIADLKMIWGEQPEEPKAPVRTGYTFTGWFKDSKWEKPWDFSEDFVNGNTTIYSGWNANMYTVSFDTAGGSEAPPSQTLSYDSLLTEPDAPSKEGYVFEGWKDSGGNIWDFSKDTLKEDMVLTAQWSEKKDENSDTGNTPGSTSGTSTGNKAAAGSDTQNTSTAGSGTGSTDTSAQALKSAAGDLKEILTGDKAPLTYSIAGIILAAAGILGALNKKMK